MRYLFQAYVPTEERIVSDVSRELRLAGIMEMQEVRVAKRVLGRECALLRGKRMEGISG